MKPAEGGDRRAALAAPSPRCAARAEEASCREASGNLLLGVESVVVVARNGVLDHQRFPAPEADG
ncbi:hypothetical protein EYF80_019836 [Liparis tanakae]|uniref:Uncharacterized protein n=1 Tax=Liparis tanakae TaxID=230148 RepID=A0A4Z2HYB0_9TELE|nr:hypothetical protein EYF80_019836 [Liparis tanakae]